MDNIEINKTGNDIMAALGFLRTILEAMRDPRAEHARKLLEDYIELEGKGQIMRNQLLEALDQLWAKGH